jgi:hypothetical protein
MNWTPDKDGDRADVTCPITALPDISNNADSCQALFEDTSFFLPERGFLFRFLSFSLFSASTTTARL